MAETQGTGTATKQQPNPDNQPTPQAQPAAAQPAQPQAQQPAATEPKTAEKTEEKTTVKTDNERTQKQFDKLLDSNKRLYEANELLQGQLTKKALANEQFDPIQQQPIQQQPAQQQVNVADFVEVNPVTGEKFIDDKKLQSKIQDLNEKASKAEKAVQSYIQTSEQREIDRQNEEAFTAYPELNPTGEEFNTRFHNQTRALIYDSLINPQDYGGKALSFKKAADFVKGGDENVSDNEKNQQASASKDKPGEQTVAEDQTQEGEDAKQQAAASVSGEQPESRDALAGSEELSKLQQATRLGDQEALARRIANSDHILEKEDESGETTS